jgi:Mce-associated membrane protein
VARVRSFILGGLIVVLVAALAAFVIAAFRTDSNPITGARLDLTQARPLQTERDEAMSQARQFMLRLNTYGPDLLAKDGTMPGYRSQVEAVTTPKFGAEFESSVGLAESTVQAGISRTTPVYSTGVAAMDDDTATVLVAGEITNTRTGKNGKSQVFPPVTYRIEVSVVETEGQWLVDGFQAVPEPGAASTTVPGGTTGGKAGTS